MVPLAGGKGKKEKRRSTSSGAITPYRGRKEERGKWGAVLICVSAGEGGGGGPSPCNKRKKEGPTFESEKKEKRGRKTARFTVLSRDESSRQRERRDTEMAREK